MVTIADLAVTDASDAPAYSTYQDKNSPSIGQCYPVSSASQAAPTTPRTLSQQSPSRFLVPTHPHHEETCLLTLCFSKQLRVCFHVTGRGSSGPALGR